MRREELRAQGLTDAQIEFVMQQNGLDITNARQNDEAVQAERAISQELRQQLETVRADLQAAQTGAATASELRRQLGEAQARLDASTKANAVRDAITQYKPRDAAMIMRLLDMDKITVGQDGTLTGLKEQMDPMKEASAFLFADAPDSSGGTPPAGGGGNAFDMNAFLRGNAG